MKRTTSWKKCRYQCLDGEGERTPTGVVMNTFFVPSSSLSILTTDFAQNGRFFTSEEDILQHLTYRVGDLIKKKNAKHVKCRYS